MSFAILFMVAVGTGMGWTWLAARTGVPKTLPMEPVLAPVRVTRLVPEVVVPAVHYSAAVKEFEKAELSFHLGGTMASLLQVKGPDGQMHWVHDGDCVRQGEILARLDPADYQRDWDVAAQKLAVAQAQLAKGEADAELARHNVQRAEELAPSGAIGKEELDIRRQTVKKVEAMVASDRRDVESARINLEQAEANLGYCVLTAPFAKSTVAARYVDTGERIAPNQKVFQILDLTRVVIAFAVPDTIVGHLALGQPVEVTCDALPQERFHGVVHKIGSVADLQTRTFAVEVRVDKPNGLRPGMIVTVWLQRSERVYLLPLSAIIPGSGKGRYDVFRIVDHGKGSLTQRTPVKFDDVVDNQVVVNLTGGDRSLKPGDRVVTTGSHRLYEGQAVHIEE